MLKIGEFIYVFSGSSNLNLVNRICTYLDVPIGNIKLGRFSDGEVKVEILDKVINSDVFLIQSTCYPVNDNLLELLLMIDAFKRASARKIIAVLPYYGYARQDRKDVLNVPISAKLVANIISIAGVDEIITMDLHSNQIQGFFDIPVNNLCAIPVICEYIESNFIIGNKVNPLIFLSPDAGGIKRARIFSKYFNTDLAIVEKYRSTSNEAKSISLVGNVKDKIVIIVDDMIDTAGTLIEAVKLLLKHNPKEIHICSTHPVLSGNSLQNIMLSPIKSVIVTDTIPLSNDALNCSKIKVVSVSKIFSEAIIKRVI